MGGRVGGLEEEEGEMVGRVEGGLEGLQTSEPTDGSLLIQKKAVPICSDVSGGNKDGEWSGLHSCTVLYCTVLGPT